MKKKLTIEDFTPKEIKNSGMTVITWNELDKKMSKQEKKDFGRWMFGQTCVPEGVYIGDLERYFRGASSFRY